MITVEPFKTEHYREVIKDSDQSYLADFITDEDLRSVEANKMSVTVMKNGSPIAVGGIILMHETRGEAWCITSRAVKTAMVSLHRAAKQYLAGSTIRRIEAVVHADFDKGHRWAKALGFELEAPLMRAHGLNGKDASLYAIVKGVGNGG